jgi:hypothetical protein
LENLLGVADGMNRAKVGKLISAENVEASMWQTLECFSANNAENHVGCLKASG